MRNPFWLALLFVLLVVLSLEFFALYAGAQCEGSKYVTIRGYTYTCGERK